MKNRISGFGIIAATLVLAGCNSGITYGTGTTHEEQTVKGLSNMFALEADQTPDIDYSARPELVMPQDKQNLPQPVDTNAQVDPSWPVSPEERIIAARESAPEPDEYGNLPTEYLTDTNKVGIRNSASLGRTANRPVNARHGDTFLQEIRDTANGKGGGAEAQRRLQQLEYSTGVQRKFLTEPPTLYRTPSANAEAGDTGISKTELDEKLKKAREEKRATDKGYIIPGSE